MKKILLIVLSLFIYQIHCADRNDADVEVEGYDIRVNIWTASGNKVRDIIEEFCRRYFIPSCIQMTASHPLSKSNIDMNATLEEAQLHKDGSYIIIKNPLIDINFRTLNGITFTVQCRTFDGLYYEDGAQNLNSFIKRHIRNKLDEKIDDRLKTIYQNLLKALINLDVKFIHQGKEIRRYSKPFQVEGLISDPNITMIVETE